VIIATFLFVLALFACIGIASSRKAKNDPRDYLLASQETAPWLVGLSAIATNNSGYMFIGVIGYT
jgi:Na+/proline symporter